MVDRPNFLSIRSLAAGTAAFCVLASSDLAQPFDFQEIATQTAASSEDLPEPQPDPSLEKNAVCMTPTKDARIVFPGEFAIGRSGPNEVVICALGKKSLDDLVLQIESALPQTCVVNQTKPSRYSGMWVNPDVGFRTTQLALPVSRDCL